WNDGTASPGVIVADTATGGFDVVGTHTYATETTYLVSFTVTDAALQLSAQTSAGAVAVLTDGQNQVLGNFAFAFIPPGGGTADAAVVTVDAELVTLPGSGAATLSVAQFQGSPLDQNLVRAAFPNAAQQTIEFCDVRVTGVGADATLKVNF